MSYAREEILGHLNQLLSPSLFEDYAPNGLQVEGTTSLSRVAFAVSATQDSIRKAVEWKANALIVHHGILWKHQGARTITGGWGERVKLCIKNDLNLIGYHLPLDAHSEVGNAVALGKEIGLHNFRPFALYKKQPMGTKGDFKTPMKASELKQKLEKILNHNVILATPDENKLIKNIGIITGGANNDWSRVLDEGLDAYLTGEISEYNWHDAIEAGVHYFAGGHHATERFGILALKDKLKYDFPKLEVTFFDSENPA